MCVYATPIDQDYVRKVMNSAVRSSGGKRDEVVLTLTLILPPNSHPNNHLNHSCADCITKRMAHLTNIIGT